LAQSPAWCGTDRSETRLGWRRAEQHAPGIANARQAGGHTTDDAQFFFKDHCKPIVTVDIEMQVTL
jgi:hypothetical protein